MNRLLVACMSVCIMTGFMGATIAASKTKDVRSGMTEAQKKELRRRGREWCRKNFVSGGAYIVRVEIMSNGRIRCWLKE